MLKIPIFDNAPITRLNRYFAEQNRAALKKEVLACKSVEECAKVCERYIQSADEVGKGYVFEVRNAINTAGLVGMVGLIGASLATGNVLFSIAGAILGFGLSVFAKNTQNITTPTDEERMHILLNGKSIKSDVQKVRASQKLKDKVKKARIDDLLATIARTFPGARTKDTEKILKYLYENYDQYSWNPDLSFCIENCGDKAGNPSFENFKKIYNLSEKVFRFFMNDFLQRECADLNEFSTGSVFERFKKSYPNIEMTDYIPVQSMKDERGIITNENYDSFSHLLSTTHWHNGLYEALISAKNLDGSIAWDAVNDMQSVCGLLQSGLDNVNIKLKDDSYMHLALSEFAKNSYDKNGKISLRSLRNTLQALNAEIYVNTLPDSKTLRMILPPYLLQIFGVKDVVLENIAETVEEKSKLYELFVSSREGNNSILQFLNYVDNPPEEIFSFLCHLTANPKTKERVAKEFSKDPRKADEIYDFLLKKLGNDKRAEEYFKTWYYDEDNGYRSSYSSYYNNEIWNKATNLLDLVKQSPNLYTAAFRKFVREKGVEPVLGELPKEFGNREIFAKLIQELKDWNKAYQKEKIKKKADDSKLATEFELVVDDYKFNVEAIHIGQSAKLKFKLTPFTTPEQSYILKFAPYDIVGNTDRARKFRDNQALRPDMPYTDSLVDFYLKENNCPNAADIRFFDYEAQAVLYGETKGSIPEFPEDSRLNLHKFRKLKEVSDIYHLGVHLNDIWKTNFLIDTEGVYKAIDTGHAKYSNLFRPLVAGKQFALANVCGRE